MREQYPQLLRLVIYLDNGPKNAGNRTQFLKRMIEFADWSGLEVRLVYYPPYHSKYNPIENQRLQRSVTLSKYDITIKPETSPHQVK